ncbi:CAP domain-containing protein [Paenibacillus sp. IHBB 10380]|uniref:CAP domain-containing protein n=1 Tax=Paenibacillus sp. IHBB 10380 TaxID=1566358 RepID=UPI0005CF9E44|nr:CAP domain-containing protein [Paenibacillus sp. IHBB 10380]AJS58120.1 serine protease [Paenibacillus sp. IHBB 10380]
MKNTLLKTMVSGAFATAVSISLILPGSASAATMQDTNVKNCKAYLEQFLKNNGSEFTWNTQVITLPIVSKPVVTKPVTTKPETTKPNTTKPVTTKPETTKPVAKPTKPVVDNNTAVKDQSSVTKQVVNLVNEERAKAGLKPLTIHAGLTTVAVDKAKDMSNNNYFDHTSPTYGSPFDMMKQYGVSYSYAGENIAKGQKTPAEVMKAWMNSQGHRENILSKNFTQIGVGYYNGHWVQEFIGN